jgi:dienelactone hydrolase
MKPAIALLFVMVFAGGATLHAKDSQAYPHEQAKLLALGKLTNPPVVRDESGEIVTVGAGELKAIYFDALEYEGKPTRAYAWLGIPKGASKKSKVPGVVLVHGGGGSAFREWVELWNTRGYAAISIAVEGQTDVREEVAGDAGRKPWKQHPWAGPKRTGIYDDSDKPITDQWMYHAVADTVLANSLLRSLPEVITDKVGLMGISWGGIITCTVIGIDDRFAFAIPTYGIGHLADIENQYGRALGNNDLYRQVWDSFLRLDRAKMPVLWFSWPGDQHFPLDRQAKCYRAAAGPHMVTLIPGMRHGHAPAWRPPDSYAFADSIVKDGKPWSKQTDATVQGNVFVAKFETTKPLDQAVLISTTDAGLTGQRRWTESPASLEYVGTQWVATATLPDGTTAWLVNVKSGELTVSSDFQGR